jgi:hypothetical protein
MKACLLRYQSRTHSWKTSLLGLLKGRTLAGRAGLLEATALEARGLELTDEVSPAQLGGGVTRSAWNREYQTAHTHTMMPIPRHIKQHFLVGRRILWRTGKKTIPLWKVPFLFSINGWWSEGGVARRRMARWHQHGHVTTYVVFVSSSGVSVRWCMKMEFLSVAVLLTRDTCTCACTTVVWLTEEDHTARR